MKETIDAYDALVEKLAGIVVGAPFWAYVGERGFTKVHVQDDEFVLSWPEAETHYDSTTIETRTVKVPGNVVRMSEAELAEWKAAAHAKYERDQAERNAIGKAQREAQERETLAALQAKYGK